MFLVLIVLFITILYFYSTKNFNYWKKRNVKHDHPIPFFGNHLPNQLGLKSLTQISDEMYRKYPNEKMVGYYRGVTPMLIIRDLDLLKQIMAIDFPYFYKREEDRNTSLEPLYRNLAHTNEDNWRLLRQHWTPAFTTVKLRAMYPFILKCAERLQSMVASVSNSGKAYDAWDFMSRFNMELIGACGFGIDMDTINSERSQFLDLGNAIFRPTLRNRILIPLFELFPVLKNFLRIDDDTVEREIKNILGQLRKQRNGKPVGRHDFIDLLLELEAKGKIVGDSILNVNKDGTPVKVEMVMDLEYQAAQVFIFLTAGYKTSSTVTSYALHMLAFHPKIQEKVHQEIDMVLSKYNESLCYDAISEMPLLEMVFKECLRLLPPSGSVRRVCARRYKIPDTDIIIDPGVMITIPIQAVHMDEKYYDNPTEFRPERFSSEATKERHKYAYLAFGEGSRRCVGIRLAQMQSLTGLAAILHKFRVIPDEKSTKDVKVIPTYNLIQTVEGGFPLIFKPRKP